MASDSCVACCGSQLHCLSTRLDPRMQPDRLLLGQIHRERQLH